MDWDLAIDRNRTMLLRLLAGLFALVGTVAGQAVETIPRHLRWRVLWLLRPMESSVRRLTFLQARGMALPKVVKRDALAGAIPKGTGARVPAFRLFDPRKDFKPHVRKYAKFCPRVRSFDQPQTFDPVPPVQMPDDLLDASLICGRLNALQNALEDLPRQARRLMRATARHPRERAFKPMRPGRPPGHRARKTHEVDEILRECQVLALRVAAEDSS